MPYSFDKDIGLPFKSSPNGDGTTTLITTSGLLSPPPLSNNGTVTYPDGITEVYRFYNGAFILKTITLVYTDSTKARLASWAVS